MYWSRNANLHPSPLQMLQNYADLASRAIRRDFLKPRIQENDFSAVDKEQDGSIIVHNARFKSRIRASEQVRRTWCCMKSYCNSISFFFRRI